MIWNLSCMRQLPLFILGAFLLFSTSLAKVAICTKEGICVLESGRQILCSWLPKNERLVLHLLDIENQQMLVNQVWRFESSGNSVEHMSTTMHSPAEHAHLTMREANKGKKISCRYLSEIHQNSEKTGVQNIDVTLSFAGVSRCRGKKLRWYHCGRIWIFGCTF
eukprot:gb/GEZJ01004144.1/.p1 GENE.gb/GEZJ01004144.1/~~gb/GEZJ01004144.1/.p1  ORF type:complete len:164 (-),score=11.51 gb/GEZJ01004144.1/:182-673(-)